MKITLPLLVARGQKGFSIIELVITLAVMGLIVSIAMPMYSGYQDAARLNTILMDMQQIELVLQDFDLDENGYPDTLADVDMARDDPWGRPYRYLPIKGRPGNLNDARKDHNLHPINSDFDLYSVGQDGGSVKPLTGGPSQDDIIRGRNGGFYGYGRDY